MARHDLRLPDDEIGRLTLAQYEALVARKRVQDNKDRLNAGIVAAAVINAFRAEGQKPISPLEFVPDWKDLAANSAPDLTTMSPEEQKNYLMSMFMGAGKGNMKNG